MTLKLYDLHVDLSYTFNLNFKGHQVQSIFLYTSKFEEKFKFQKEEQKYLRLKIILEKFLKLGKRKHSLIFQVISISLFKQIYLVRNGDTFSNNML